MKKTIILILIILVASFAVANRIIDADQITSSDKTKTFSLPAATDTLVGRASTDTLTNKTISGASNTISNLDLVSSITGVLAISNGGTGANNAQSAIDGLVPDQTLENGKYLSTDGTNVFWDTVSGGGLQADGSVAMDNSAWFKARNNTNTTDINMIRVTDVSAATFSLPDSANAIEVGTSIVPAVNAAFDIGGLNLKRWRNLYMSGTFNTQGNMTVGGNFSGGGSQINPNPTLPSGAATRAAFRSDTATASTGIFTPNTTSTTGLVGVMSGNVTAGAGASGNVHIRTGTSTGTRGNIIIEGNRIDASSNIGAMTLPVLTADPSSPVNGDIWYNSTDNKMRIRANSLTVDLN